MSSSFGGSGGFSGSSSNTVRYAIVIDDSQVNSKLSNFQNSLTRLGSATQSSTSGLQSLNTGIQNLDSNLQNTGTDLDAINNNFRNMDSSLQSTSQNMGALNNNFQNATGGLTEFNTLQGQVGDGTLTMGQRMKTAGGFMKDNALAIGVVSSSIIGLVSSYTDLQKSQLAAERATILSDRAQQKVVKLQEKINKLIMEGKEGTKEYTIAQEDLRIATEFSGVATERAALATATANQNMARFIPETVQQIVMLTSGVATMISGFRDLRLSAGGIKTALTLIGSGFIGMAGPILAVVGGIWLTLGAIKAFNNVNALFTKNIETGGKAISLWEAQWLSMKESAPQIFGTLTKEEAGWLAAHRKNMSLTAEEAGVTAEQIQEEIKNAFINPLPDEVMKGLEDIIAKLTGVPPAAADAGEGIDDLGQAVTKIIDPTTQTTAALLDLRTGLEALPPGVSASALALNEMGKGFDFTKEAAEQANVEIDSVLQTLEHSLPIWDKQIAASVTLEEVLIGDIMALEGLDQAFADAAEEGSKLNKMYDEFKGKSRLELFTVFDVKTPEDQKEKFLDKIRKFLPNKIEKKIELILKAEAKDKGFKDAAAGFIAGLEKEILADDKLADATIKAIAKATPDTPEGKKFKEWLLGLIPGEESGAKLIEGIETSAEGTTINIPAQLDFAKGGLGVIGETENADKGLLGPGYKGGLTVPVDSVTVTPKTIKISDVEGGSSGFGISALTNSGEMLRMSSDVEVVPKSIKMTSMEGEFAGILGLTGNKPLQMDLDNSKAIKSVDVVAKRIDSLTSLKPNISLLNKVAIKAIDVIAKRIDSLEKLKPQISLQNKNAIKAIDVVVKRIEKLSSLTPTITVKVKYDESGRPQSLGGVHTFKKGGVISAQSGYTTTTSGPQLFLAGDNPGGRETVAFIPHNNPNPTLEKIARIFGGGGGSQPVNINLTLPISGSEFINERNLRKMIKLELGKNRDRFM